MCQNSLSRLSPRAMRLANAWGDGHTHDEYEERENEVGETPTVPASVAQGGVDRAWMTVNKHHPQQGESTKDVERYQPLRLAKGRLLR